jgi:hypothetical protein
MGALLRYFLLWHDYTAVRNTQFANHFTCHLPASKFAMLVERRKESNGRFV